MTNREPSRLSRRAALTAFGAAALTVGGALAVTNAANATDTPPQSGSIPDDLRPGGRLDKFVAQLAAEDRFSGTVLLVHRDRPVLTRSYGMANKDLQLPNRPDTIFALASITKLFTQVAIDQLAEQDLVAYDGKLGDYLDGFPPEIADSVTVEHLLTHTSGMGDFHSPEFFDEARTWDSATEVMDGTMAYIRRGTLSFPPGTGNQYSNSGYVTLGAIVEKVSKQSYYAYVKKHVFVPAHMTSADFYTTPHWRADRRIARPYTQLPTGERVDVIDNNIFIGTPAGGSFATAADLVRFVRTHKVGQPINAHGGNPGGGVCADLDSYPDSGWVTVVLSNYEDATQAIDDLTRKIITGGGVRI
jgi:CubicO group peptidase (beta-lactamase class C family)